MINPIIQREFLTLLRTRKAFVMQLMMAVTFAAVVVLRWPTDALVDLSGARALNVFRLFGYSLMTALVLLVPAFPATSIVRERQRGTMALLLNSPMSSVSIYFGKLVASLAFVLLLLVMTLPAAAACYAMGGVSLLNDVALLYAILMLVAIQFTALGLLVSTYANSADGAQRITYAGVLGLVVATLVPHQFFQAHGEPLESFCVWLRCVSPIPAVMEIVGDGDAGSHGLDNAAGAPLRFALASLVVTAVFAIATILRLNHKMFDRSRAAGVMTEDRGVGGQVARRMFFLIDPQRRKSNILWFANPVMVKEFRCRRFGRFHWTLRLVAVCAVASLALTLLTTRGTIEWKIETVAGIMVLMQVALIVLLTPSLSAGLISSERESGGWTLLQMTPLSGFKIVRGKLLSVFWILLLLLCATLPGYLAIVKIEPKLWHQIFRVLVCLLLTSVFAMLLSAAVSSMFRRTALATATAYVVLVAVCAGPLLIWLGRGAPFGHSTVETALRVNPIAAALGIVNVMDFRDYDLMPANWYFLGGASVLCFVVLAVQTWRLTRPQ